MRDNRRGAEITVQSMPYALEYRKLCTAHVDISWKMILPKTRSTSHPCWICFSIPNFYIRKGRPHGHRYGKAPGCKEYHTANQLQKRCRKKKYDNIHDRFIRDKTLQEDDDWVGSLWRDHPWDGSDRKRKPVILPPEQKLMSTVATGGFARTWWISIRCRQGINLTSRKHWSTLYRPKKAEDKKQSEKWSQSSSSLVAMANKLVGVRLWEFTTKMVWPLIERWNLCIQWATIHLRYESQQELNAKFIVNISVTADSSLLSPTGGVKRIPPDTEIHEQMAT